MQNRQSVKSGLIVWAETQEIQKYYIQMFTHTQNVHLIHIVVAIATSPGIDPLPLSWSEP